MSYVDIEVSPPKNKPVEASTLVRLGAEGYVLQGVRTDGGQSTYIFRKHAE